MVKLSRAGSPARARALAFPGAVEHPVRPGAAVADRVALGAGDGDAYLGAGAGGRGGGHLAGEGGVEQAEALDLAGPPGQPEQRRQRDDQVGGRRWTRPARRWQAWPGQGSRGRVR